MPSKAKSPSKPSKGATMSNTKNTAIKLPATLTCIVCPIGCTLQVTGEVGNLTVTGNTCPRGKKYAEQEVTCPMRTVTSTVKLQGSEEACLIPVKTAAPIPKEKIEESLTTIRKAAAKAPVHIGDVIVENIADTGVALIATGNAPAPRKGERFRSHVLLGQGEFLVTSPYGERIHPITGEKNFHNGIDGALWAEGSLVETGICAADDGVVLEAHELDDSTAGVHVIIDHGNGLVTKYFHLEPETLRVKKGDKVTRAQLIGWMGTTGASTGEHLHFQAEIDGKTVDPTPYLRESRQ